MVKNKKFTLEEINRIIEMAWEDRTPFEAIEYQFGINQDGVIKLMRENLKLRELELVYGGHHKLLPLVQVGFLGRFPAI